MKKRIGLIYATLNSVQPILDAFQEHAPEAVTLNFMDEELITDLNRLGKVTPRMLRRLIHLVEKAEESGVDGILLTCSCFTPYVPIVQKFFDTPIQSADYSMLELAVEKGNRIAVIATVEKAGPTTAQLIQEIADERKKEIEIQIEVMTEAFSALQNGYGEKHDEMIQQKIREVSTVNDVVVLAQFSMARALIGLGENTKPVLTSPEVSVKSMMSRLSQQDGE
ncbi:aspartate/glutamate racemase family protein [Ammoniphilus sp. YIM 78166]|uniref:aspartate/glutamate racemase family protein n=1 Tax=Ammoniphilus sp. YIM 78166 TaxID=1644106 RepID=UPI00106FC36D|nr:aspartate/glutamate racemase family protein [Ammoniphilus sp. YIM 78166]